MLFTGKPPCGGFYFFGNLADLECISAILWKAHSTTDFFPYGTCKIAFFKISDIYLGEIFTIPFFWIIKSKIYIDYIDLTFREYIDLTFNHRDDTYCVKDNVYI